jgi:transcriptional regulator with XRE-family HTH domain
MPEEEYLTPEVIRKARVKKGYTQKGLGEKLGISGVNVSRWENGVEEVPDRHRWALAEILDLNYLILLVGNPLASLDDVDEWRSYVSRQPFAPMLKLTLMTLPEFLHHDSMVIAAKPDSIAAHIGLSEEKLAALWPDVIETGLARKIGEYDYVVQLLHPLNL